VNAEFASQLRQGARAALLWGLPLAALCILEVSIYPSVHKSLSKVVADYPKGLKEAFNLTSFSTARAFLDAEMFSLIIPFSVGFFAIRSVLRGTVTREERGWLDVILAAPLTRAQLVVASSGATLCATLLLLIVVAVPTEIVGALVGASIPVTAMLAAVASMWAFGAFFTGVAAAAGGIWSRASVVTGVGAGLLVTMYVVDLAGKIAHSLSWARWGTVFRYTSAALERGLDLAGCLAIVAVGVALMALGAMRFSRRDIRA
jgi:ABC-2 type transport system permease protein